MYVFFLFTEVDCKAIPQSDKGVFLSRECGGISKSTGGISKSAGVPGQNSPRDAAAFEQINYMGYSDRVQRGVYQLLQHQVKFCRSDKFSIFIVFNPFAYNHLFNTFATENKLVCKIWTC